MEKKIVYIDMDGVLVDFQSGVNKLSQEIRDQYGKDIDDYPGIFALMDPMPGAIDAVNKLKEKYDLYILSTAPWKNPTALNDKLEWVKRHFNSAFPGGVFYKRLILSHHKNLNRGDYLIDDRNAHGVEDFQGQVLQLNPEDKFKAKNGISFKTWDEIVDYLMNKQP